MVSLRPIYKHAPTLGLLPPVVSPGNVSSYIRVSQSGHLLTLQAIAFFFWSCTQCLWLDVGNTPHLATTPPKMSPDTAEFPLVEQKHPQLRTTSNDWLFSLTHSASVQSPSHVPHTSLRAGDAAVHKPEEKSAL